MRPAEEMDKQIARNAAAVVLPLAPLKEPLSAEWHFWRRTLEAWPIASLRRGIRRNRVVPRPHRRVPIPSSRNHVQFPNRARGQQFLGFRIQNRTYSLTANLQDTIRRLRRLDHLRPIFVLMDHRLFAIDILARLHRINGSLLVPVVRRADDDGIDVLARKNLVVVASGKRVGAPYLLAALE